jgi:protein-S-isoprenylcysteine O-methyltransferase Ste14
MRTVDLVFVIGWLLFWAGWLAAAAGVKTGRTRWGRQIGARVILIPLILALRRVPAFRGHALGEPWLDALGLAMFGSGLALAVWARMHLGRNWGTPMSEKSDPELITTGPYRWIRNPIYSGLILAMVGTALTVSLDWLAVVVLVGGYFVYCAVMEQRYMTAQFPDTYPAYRDATKMLVPYVF